MAEQENSVFISYSHKDREICDKIDSIIERQPGFQVWYDKGLLPGEVYRKRIAEAIRESAYFIILLSKTSVASDWVLDEVEYAKKLCKRILPIWLEDVEIPDDLDMILQRFHSLFWHLRSSDEQFEESLMSMFGVTEKKPVGQALVGFGNEYSAKVNARMRELLVRESENRFSEIYKPENAVLLGEAYLTGGPCSVDRDKARHFFRAADYFGSPDGEFYLLRMKLEDRVSQIWDDPDETFTRPVVNLIRDLAGEGCIPAMLYMGNLCWYGRFGVAENRVRSASYYEECARRGNARAQYVMSSNYYYGEGVQVDYELAKMYANLALEQRYIYAWRRWGKFFRDGKAVEQDYARARECYEKGAQVGDYNCYNKIGDMLYHGWGCEADPAEAVRYFEKGEQAPEFSQRYSLQRAKSALGRAYEFGRGVERDLAVAAQKYYEGYEAGSLECRDSYLRCSRQLQGDAEKNRS